MADERRKTNLPHLLSEEGKRARERGRRTLSTAWKMAILAGERAAKEAEETAESVSVPPPPLAKEA